MASVSVVLAKTVICRAASATGGYVKPRSGYRSAMDAGQLLNDLCVRLGYCLPPEDQREIVNNPPTSVDAFTDAVIVAEGLNPFLMATEQRQEVRRMVAAAFGEPVRPSGRNWRRR